MHLLSNIPVGLPIKLSQTLYNEILSQLLEFKHYKELLKVVKRLLPHLVNYGEFILKLSAILKSNYEEVKTCQDFFLIFEQVS